MDVRRQRATNDPTLQELHALLQTQLRFGPEYGQGLSNHLPMALHALAELRADGNRLRTAFDRYLDAHRLPAMTESGAMLADWPATRGDIARYADLRATFDDLLARRGIDGTLRSAVPQLWPGAVGAAFHGLIRTAHAVQAGHIGELAAALAYWAARWQALPIPTVQRPAASFPDWARALEAAAQRLQPPGGLIAERAVNAAASPDYAELAATAPLLEGWSELVDWGAGLYARSGNFTVLHIVTGTRAARVMAPWAGDPAAARSAFLRATVAAALASHLAVHGSPGVQPEEFDWHMARVGARASDDEHVIKLIHALHEMRRWDGSAADDKLRLAAAARAMAGA
ncbi:MAG TPA: questin oxidase family protein [Rubrivivax sp.]|nr:questin oxidase family protein [Rubrivivax sp.]